MKTRKYLETLKTRFVISNMAIKFTQQIDDNIDKNFGVVSNDRCLDEDEQFSYVVPLL